MNATRKILPTINYIEIRSPGRPARTVTTELSWISLMNVKNKKK